MSGAEASWSLGVLVGGPICALIILGCLGFTALALYESEVGIAVGSFIGTLAIVALIMSPLGFYPYSAEYHQWREVGGTVEQIDKRLIGSGDKMEDKFVIRFEGSGMQYGCDDTRCAQVEAGDELALSCKRAWQYTGTDGYDCRFVTTEAAR